jgi:hypothetical protein
MKKQIKNLENKAVKNIKTVKGGNNGGTVVFDYRGFGKSSDFEIDNNMY